MVSQEISYLVPIVAIAAALITGIFTILGVTLANRASHKQLSLKLDHEHQKEQKAALRGRLEELYQLIDTWAGSFVTHHITYRQVMNGVLTYNQALDLDLQRDIKENSSRMFTLAELYFPDCHEELDKIKSLRDVASDIQHEFKEMYRETGSESKKHSEGITKTLGLFNSSIDQYKKQLSEYVRKV